MPLACQPVLALVYCPSMNICLFSKEEIEQPLAWNDERAEHILKVLHKKEGDSFTAGIIEGQSGKAVITKINPKVSIEFSFTGDTAESGGNENEKPLYPLSMIIGFPRPIQLKRLLRDLAGLGSNSIHLTGTELGEKSYLQSNLLEKGAAYKMLLDGTVQAGSTHIPKLYMHKNLADCVTDCEKSEENKKTDIPVLKIALDNVGAKCSLKEFIEQKLFEISSVQGAEKNHLESAIPVRENAVGALAPAGGIARFAAIAAIGSERGWTEKERTLLEKNGFTRCSMGSRILRTESAATVAASIILNYMGVLN